MNQTTFAFDQFDRVTKVTDPESHWRETVFDKNGNALTSCSKNSSADVLAHSVGEFDKDNLLTKGRERALTSASVSLGGGSGWLDRTYTYDKAGLLVTKLDPCGCSVAAERTNTSFTTRPLG